MPYAPCPMPHALCPVVPHLSEKGYIYETLQAELLFLAVVSYQIR